MVKTSLSPSQEYRVGADPQRLGLVVDVVHVVCFRDHEHLKRRGATGGSEKAMGRREMMERRRRRKKRDCRG